MDVQVVFWIHIAYVITGPKKGDPYTLAHKGVVIPAQLITHDNVGKYRGLTSKQPFVTSTIPSFFL